MEIIHQNKLGAIYIMKTIVKWGLLFFFIVQGCAGMDPSPKNAEEIGVYHGTFFGTRFQGNLRIRLSVVPDGTQFFKGSFRGSSQDIVVFFRGQLTGNRLDGKLLAPASGDISGSLTPDATQIKGTYRLTSPSLDNGTWEAQRR
jgi:hypothetical protein